MVGCMVTCLAKSLACGASVISHEELVRCVQSSMKAASLTLKYKGAVSDKITPSIFKDLE